MSKVKHNVVLDILNPQWPPEIHLCELDSGHQICFHIAGMDLTGYTATIWVVKPSGKRVWNNCTVNNQCVIADITNQMLAENGLCVGQIKLKSTADGLVTPCDFVLKVRRDRSGDGLESKNESTVIESMICDVMENMGIDATLTKTGYAADAAVVGRKFGELSGQIPNQGGTSADVKTILENIMTIMKAQVQINVDGTTTPQAYSPDISDIAKQTDTLIANLNSGGGEVEPDTPVNPEATLTSISATYTGGSVTVGTSVNSLTGITVKATYSDGSTAPVTGYTLSGTIAEGSNTVTVSYQGKTTTFVVVGITESGGEEVPTDWDLLGVYKNETADPHDGSITGERIIKNLDTSVTEYYTLIATSNTVFNKSIKFGYRYSNGGWKSTSMINDLPAYDTFTTNGYTFKVVKVDVTSVVEELLNDTGNGLYGKNIVIHGTIEKHDLLYVSKIPITKAMMESVL